MTKIPFLVECRVREIQQTNDSEFTDRRIVMAKHTGEATDLMEKYWEELSYDHGYPQYVALDVNVFDTIGS